MVEEQPFCLPLLYTMEGKKSMENQKPKYDINELLGAVSTGNEPLQPVPEKLEIKLPGSDGSVSTFILPAPVSFKNVCKNIPPLAPVLIPGMLRQGHKMMIASSSKAGKSFLVEELAIAVAHGKSWLNNPCKKGPVLYVNMELSDSSCWNRFSTVYEALNNSENGTSGNFNPSTTGNLDVWNLRGQQVTANQLAAAIEQLDKKYTLIILDPIYKLFEGSENDQESTANFCKAVDRMAETGASVVYVHHHSKSSMDRASGSGVFARDVDALLDLTQLFPGGKEPTAEASKKTVWKVETTLREFAPLRPFIVSFQYPLHHVESSTEYVGWKPRSASSAGGSTRADQQTAAKESAKERCAKEFEAWNEEHGEPPTVRELAEVLGKNEKTVRGYLNDLELKPRVEKRGRKKAA